jgi:hypothetical protein
MELECSLAKSGENQAELNNFLKSLKLYLYSFKRYQKKKKIGFTGSPFYTVLLDNVNTEEKINK